MVSGSRWMWVVGVLVGLALSGGEAGAGEDYIILTPARLRPVAEGFASWRGGRGRRPGIVDYSALAAEDDAAGIVAARAEVRRRYEAAGRPDPFFLLILGDAAPEGRAAGRERVPCGYVEDRSEQTAAAGRRDETVATDNVYAWMDDADEVPDICVGRVPCRDVAEGLAILEKVRAYETRSEWGPWRRRLTFVAGEGRFGVGDRILEMLFTQLADELIPYDFDLHMTYANPSSPYVVPPDELSQTVLERCNEGALILNYIGHGHDRSLDTMRWGGGRAPILGSEDLRRFAAAGRAPIFFVVACNTGRVDRRDDRPCIAEELIAQDGGPIAVFASSRVSHPYPNAVLQLTFLQEVCARRSRTLGEAVRRAKAETVAEGDRARRRLELFARVFVPKGEREELLRSHLSMYNLVGDPGLELPTAAAAEVERVGEELRVALPAGSWGRALVTLECERSVMLRPVREGLPEGPGALDAGGARESVRESYANANDKVVRGWRCEVRDGRLVWPEAPDWSLPRIPGKYYVKVYAWGEGWSVAGSCEAGEVGRGVEREWLGPRGEPASGRRGARLY